MTLDRSGSAVARALAVLAVAAMVLTLLPLSGTAAAQEDPPLSDACPFQPQPSGFTDREGISAAHRQNVDCAAFLNIVQGFADNTYRPRLLVRRDQIASFISLTLDAAGVLLPSGAQDQFTDIAADSPHRPHINRLAQVGIILGGPGNLPPEQFGPGLRVRRDALASFLMRAAGYAFHEDPDAFSGDFDGPEDQRFTDVPAGNVHFGNVNAAAHLRLAQGVGDGLYRPRNAATRDQIASFVVRLLNFLMTRPALELRLVLEPADVHIGDSVLATAAVTRDGEPIQGVDVAFTVPGGAEPGTGTVQTNAEGLAAFPFTATQAGSVPVTARATVDGEQLVATATVIVTAPPALALGLVVNPSRLQAGGTVTTTATLTRDGQPVPGVDVAFTTSGAATGPIEATVPTDSEGRAQFSFEALEAGTVRVNAAATLNGRELSRDVTVTVIPRLTLHLDPDEVVLNDETVTARATLTRRGDGGDPVVDNAVTFSISGPATDPVPMLVNTDDSGRVTSRFTVTGPGTVTVTAEATVNGQPVRTTAQLTVHADPAQVAARYGPDG